MPKIEYRVRKKALRDARVIKIGDLEIGSARKQGAVERELLRCIVGIKAGYKIPYNSVPVTMEIDVPQGRCPHCGAINTVTVRVKRIHRWTCNSCGGKFAGPS